MGNAGVSPRGPQPGARVAQTTRVLNTCAAFHDAMIHPVIARLPLPRAILDTHVAAFMMDDIVIEVGVLPAAAAAAGYDAETTTAAMMRTLHVALPRTAPIGALRERLSHSLETDAAGHVVHIACARTVFKSDHRASWPPPPPRADLHGAEKRRPPPGSNVGALPCAGLRAIVLRHPCARCDGLGEEVEWHESCWVCRELDRNDLLVEHDAAWTRCHCSGGWRPCPRCGGSGTERRHRSLMHRRWTSASRAPMPAHESRGLRGLTVCRANWRISKSAELMCQSADDSPCSPDSIDGLRPPFPPPPGGDATSIAASDSGTAGQQENYLSPAG